MTLVKRYGPTLRGFTNILRCKTHLHENSTLYCLWVVCIIINMNQLASLKIQQISSLYWYCCSNRTQCTTEMHNTVINLTLMRDKHKFNCMEYWPTKLFAANVLDYQKIIIVKNYKEISIYGPKRCALEWLSVSG